MFKARHCILLFYLLLATSPSLAAEAPSRVVRIAPLPASHETNEPQPLLNYQTITLPQSSSAPTEEERSKPDTVNSDKSRTDSSQLGSSGPANSEPESSVNAASNTHAVETPRSAHGDTSLPTQSITNGLPAPNTDSPAHAQQAPAPSIAAAARNQAVSPAANSTGTAPPLDMATTDGENPASGTTSPVPDTAENSDAQGIPSTTTQAPPLAPPAEPEMEIEAPHAYLLPDGSPDLGKIPPSKMESGSSLPLAGIREFEQFKQEYTRLEKAEQIHYAYLPYTYRLDSASDTGEEESKTETLTSYEAIRLMTKEWRSFFVTDLLLLKSTWVIVTIEDSPEKAVVCLTPQPGGPCLSQYEFIWFDNCWRLAVQKDMDIGL